MKIILNCCPKWVWNLIELFNRQKWEYLTQTAEPKNTTQVFKRRRFFFCREVSLTWTKEGRKEQEEKKKRKNGSLLPRMISCWRRHRSPARQGGPIPTRRGRQSGLWEEERSVAPDKLVGAAEGGRRRRVDGGTRAEAGDAVFQGEEECRITGRYWFFSINAEASQKHTPDAAAAKVN